MGNSKEFDRQRFQWLDQILADTELPDSAFKVAFVVNQGFREDYDGEAWMGFRYIAERTRLAKRTVIDDVRLLQERGHWQFGGGRPGSGHAHRYAMILKGEAETDAPKADKGTDSAPFKGTNSAPLGPTTKGASSARKGASSARKGAKVAPEPTTTQRRPNGGESPPPNFSLKEEASSGAGSPAGHRSDARGRDGPAAFAAFWAAYPKQIGKAGAEREFGRAVRQHKATAEQIIAAAKRFAAEQRGKDPQFIPGPINWLRDGRYADESIGVTIDQHGNPVAAAARSWKSSGSCDIDKVGEQVKAMLRATGGRP
jgi:hypothetical protein